MKIRPMMKYLALIMNGMGKSMISDSAWRMPKASSSPKIAPDAPTVGTSGLAPSRPVKETATVVSAAPMAQKK